MEPSAPRLISVSDVLTRLSIRKTLLYSLIAAGELRPIKLGRRTLFAESEIASWLDAKIAASRTAA